MCKEIETIETHIPWWMPTAKIRIEATKDDAKDQHDETQIYSDATTVTIYTDGSGTESKIGISNLATNEVANTTGAMQINLCTEELTALYLAVKLWNHGKCLIDRIYTDSQATAKAIDHPRKQSGQTIMKDVVESIDEIVN